MRVKKGFKARRRRKEILKAARGNYSRRARTFKVARETVERGWAFSYVSRKLKKRDFRALWIMRINAAARERGLSYSVLMNLLSKAKVTMDRKLLAHLAMEDPKAFDKIVDTAKALITA